MEYIACALEPDQSHLLKAYNGNRVLSDKSPPSKVLESQNIL
jgi:hypothetical protein